MSAITKYLPSEVEIFPNFPSELQKVILLQCDADGLLCLSGVNVAAAKFLTNELFKELFHDEYSCLDRFDRIFVQLRSIHPSNCGKVMCQVMASSWEGHHKKDNTISIALRLSPTFLKEALADISAVKAHRDQKAQRLKEICGSHYEDPHSEIDQAWKGLKKCEEESKTISQEFVQMVSNMNTEMQAEFDNIGSSATLEEIQSIRADIKGDLDNSDFEAINERFQRMSYEEFKKKTHLAREGMSRERFLLHQKYSGKSVSLNQICQKHVSSQQQQQEFNEKYHKLEDERKCLESEIQFANEHIQEFDSDPNQAHIDELTADWIQARMIKQFSDRKIHLEKCELLIQKLMKSSEDPTSEIFAEIRRSINASEESDRISIWKKLYEDCANGVIESSWAENHFVNHISSLYLSVSKRLSDINFRIDFFDRRYNSHYIPR